MKLRDELDRLRRAIDDCQVAVRVRTTDLNRAQQQAREALDGLNARLARIEDDVASIKEYLVTKMRADTSQGDN